jgi:hypothetical protein
VMSSIQVSWLFTQSSTLCCRLRSFPTAPLSPLQPQVGPSPTSLRTTTAVPRFRVVPSASDLRLPLYTRTMLSAPAMNLFGLYPYSQRQSVLSTTFPWCHSASGTVHLSPSLSVIGLAILWMLQTRVSCVAIVRLRLAASGQGRVCPYPHVPRASSCLFLTLAPAHGFARVQVLSTTCRVSLTHVGA